MEKFIAHSQERINQALLAKLPLESVKPYALHQAMRYAVLNGGKRLRATLIFAIGEALGVEQGIVTDIGVAIELIHAFSLVHDDLPAIDNDDLRRGKPTCHVIFGEATAILAGDALHSLAFEILAQSTAPPAILVKMLRLLAQATGSRGMIGGESLDVNMTNTQVEVVDLEHMYQLKTACLLSVGMEMVALIANYPQIQLIKQFGENLGIAFQIHDDIIGIESDTQTLGKMQKADLEANKPVYPVLVGLEAAKKRRDYLQEQALSCLTNLKIPSEKLSGLANIIISRKS